MNEPYAIAQRAMADLKAAVYLLLKTGPSSGLRNADIGRALGIYPESKLWTVKSQVALEGEPAAV